MNALKDDPRQNNDELLLVEFWIRLTQAHNPLNVLQTLSDFIEIRQFVLNWTLHGSAAKFGFNRGPCRDIQHERSSPVLSIVLRKLIVSEYEII